jgi:5'-phosphate synthase pdxT subunit
MNSEPVKKKVGVLSLQGDFAAHGAAIERAGAEPVFVREPAQFERLDGLVIPGGESTTMLKLLEIENLLEPLREFGRNKPVYGSCAGAILIAHEVSHPSQTCLDLMDIGVERNAYGRQVDSHIAKIKIDENEGGGELEAVFIRAPIIRRVGETARVLARHQGDPVWVEQGRHMVTTFHPELTDDVRVHRRFVEKLLEKSAD